MAEPTKAPAPPTQPGTPPTPGPVPSPAGQELDADQLQGVAGGVGRRDGLS